MKTIERLIDLNLFRIAMGINLKVIYLSGYIANVIAHHEHTGRGDAFQPKTMHRKKMADTIMAVFAAKATL